VRSYLDSANLLVDHLDLSGVTSASSASRLDIEKWLIGMGDVVSPGTVLTRFRAVRVFWNWLVEAEEIERSPMARMREPRVEQRPPAVISDSDATRLLRSCSGKTLEERRDHLLLRFLLDTGCRISEAIGLRVDDVDTATRTALVMGKGRKACVVPIGNKTAAAHLAYLRERRKHRCTESDALFLGQRGPLKSVRLLTVQHSVAFLDALLGMVATMIESELLDGDNIEMVCAWLDLDVPEVGDVVAFSSHRLPIDLQLAWP
jgi:site-specific recombinase XerD